MEEKELVKASESGDEEAFSSLVKKYLTKVFNMVLHFTRDSQVADDLAQEIFIKAYFALPGFKHRSEFGTWLYRIAVNHVKDYLRKKKKVKEISLNYMKEPPAAEEDVIRSEERESMEEQKKQVLRRLIDELPEKSKVILTLRDIQGFSYEEITKILRISMGTVDSRLFRARRMLRQKFTTFLKEEGGKYGL